MRYRLPAWLAFVLAAMLTFAGAPFAQAADTHGLDLANLDQTILPAADFYRFANGGWLQRTQIPADESSFGVFTALSEQTRKQLLGMMRDLEAGGGPTPGSDEWKAVQLFEQGTDTTARNAAGMKPIEPILAQIDAIANLHDLHAFMRGGMFLGVTGLLPVGVDADLANSGENAVYLGGPWLGLPNRDYYTKDDPDNERVRAAYIDTGAKLLGFIGYDAAKADAAAHNVYDLEKRLAETTLTREQEQDISLSYNPTPFATLKGEYPAMDWQAYFQALDLPPVDRVIVTETGYLKALPGILAGADLATLKDYLRLQVLWGFSDVLSSQMLQTVFDGYYKVLSGQDTLKPLDERIMSAVNGALPDAIGKLYVERYFPPEAKASIESLVGDILAAFHDRLEQNAWMSPVTRDKALAKLAAVRVKVGYPDKWKTYEKVEIGPTYADSMLSASVAEMERQLAKAGKPVDRSEWGMPPQAVNAYYNPGNNEIVFPAAILQPPFFDYQADPATNYGAIGYVIGHEITHGFDLQGSQFDAQGNLNNWWTPQDKASFDALTNALVKQYDAIEVKPGLHINGQITVTENTADLGGIQVAYDALQRRLAEQAATPAATPVATAADDPALAEFTPAQRFFIAAATVWREKTRDSALVTQIKSDEHSPAAVRGVQPLRNMQPFFDAFHIVPGDPMYLPPDQRVVIW
ncbi:MAG TPA: M13 family metallopeptidase [Thermomicrobiales bacterium]|nr:M13 family metallopeptidase [Thermomicrobiales bacterium]